MIGQSLGERHGTHSLSSGHMEDACQLFRDSPLDDVGEVRREDRRRVTDVVLVNDAVPFDLLEERLDQPLARGGASA